MLVCVMVVGVVVRAVVGVVGDDVVVAGDWCCVLVLMVTMLSLLL